MPRRPLIALTSWENVKGEQIEAYRRRLREVDLDPIDFRESGQSLNDCAGLVLTGGVDVDPALYGQQAGQRTQTPKRERDAFELELLRSALAADLPVLAICRGHQLLNVALGGSLLQHIDSGEHESMADPAQSSRCHTVSVRSGTRLERLLGGDQFFVNSRHHQAVTPERLAPDLRVAAVSNDGFVEAVESEQHRWVVGVQWHPEREEPQIDGFATRSRRLFEAFREVVQRSPAQPAKRLL